MGKKSQKLFKSTAIATVVLAASPLVLQSEIEVQAQGKFPDVQSANYYYDAVQSLSSRGIINGFTDGKFHPEENITRGQMGTILVRLLQLDTANVTNPGFKDVPTTHPNYHAIAALANAGILHGNTDQTFRPNEPIKREHLAKVLTKAFQLTADTEKTTPFVDVNPNFENYIKALYQNGISIGKTNNTFDGNAFVTRGQFAVLVTRSEKATSNVAPITKDTLKIISISEGKIETSKGIFTPTPEIAAFLNKQNEMALIGADISVKIEKGQLIELSSITINNGGTKEAPVLFETTNASFEGEINIQADHVHLKDFALNGNMTISDQVTNLTLEDVDMQNLEMTGTPTNTSALTLTLKSANIQILNIARNNIVVNSNKTLSEIHVGKDVTSLQLEGDVSSLIVGDTNALEIKGKGQIQQLSVAHETKLKLSMSGKIDVVNVKHSAAILQLTKNINIDRVTLPEGANARNILPNYSNLKSKITNLVDENGKRISISENTGSKKKDRDRNNPAPQPPIQSDKIAPTLIVQTESKLFVGKPITIKSNETRFIYIVPSSETITSQANLDQLIASQKGKKGTITKTNTQESFTTDGLAQGEYKIYVVDAAGNISSPTTVTLVEKTPYTIVDFAISRFENVVSNSTDFTNEATQLKLIQNLLAVNLLAVKFESQLTSEELASLGERFSEATSAIQLDENFNVMTPSQLSSIADFLILNNPALEDLTIEEKSLYLVEFCANMKTSPIYRDAPELQTALENVEIKYFNNETLAHVINNLLEQDTFELALSDQLQYLNDFFETSTDIDPELKDKFYQVIELWNTQHPNDLIIINQPVPTLNTAVAAPGTAVGTTKIEADISEDHQLYVQILSNPPIKHPRKGETISSYSANLYEIGTNLVVDENPYVAVYEVEQNSGAIRSYKLIELTNDQLHQDITAPTLVAIDLIGVENEVINLTTGEITLTSGSSLQSIKVTTNENLQLTAPDFIWNGEKLGTVAIDPTDQKAFIITLEEPLNLNMVEKITVNLNESAQLTDLAGNPLNESIELNIIENLSMVQLDLENGVLIDTTARMEYSLDNGESWTDCTDGQTAITLSIGNRILVRDKQNVENRKSLGGIGTGDSGVSATPVSILQGSTEQVVQVVTATVNVPNGKTVPGKPQVNANIFGLYWAVPIASESTAEQVAEAIVGTFRVPAEQNGYIMTSDGANVVLTAKNSNVPFASIFIYGLQTGVVDANSTVEYQVTSPVTEKASWTITNGSSKNSIIVVKVNEDSHFVKVSAQDSASEVAEKIRATLVGKIDGYEISVNGQTVEFISIIENQDVADLSIELIN